MPGGGREHPPAVYCKGAQECLKHIAGQPQDLILVLMVFVEEFAFTGNLARPSSSAKPVQPWFYMVLSKIVRSKVRKRGS